MIGGLKKKKPLNAQTRKSLVTTSSAAKKVFHDSFVPLFVSSNNGVSCSRLKKGADVCPITVVPYDDDVDNKLALRSLPLSSILNDMSSARFRRHFSGSQLLKPFPGSRASTASSTRGLIKFDLTVKPSLLTDTQKEFIQLDSDDDLDNDFEDVEENCAEDSTYIKRSVPSSSSSASTSGTGDPEDRSEKRTSECGQEGFDSHDNSRGKSGNRDNCIYIDSADSKKGSNSKYDPRSSEANHDMYDTSSPLQTSNNSDNEDLDDNLEDNLEDTPPRQKRSKELLIRSSDSRSKDVQPSQGTGRLNRSALKTDQNNTAFARSSLLSKALPDKYSSHSSSNPPYNNSRTENLIDSDDDCASNSRRKVPRTSSDSSTYFESGAVTWTCKSCTLENSVRDEMCTACMQHQADNKIHDLNSIEGTPVHSKEGHKSQKSRGQADNADNHIRINNNSSSSSTRGSGKKQVSLVVKKEKTSTERARSVWVCTWCKAENGMRRLKCELCSQRRVTEENINNPSSESESESQSSGDEDEDDATVEDGSGSGSGEDDVSDFDDEYQKEKKKKIMVASKNLAASSSSSSSKNDRTSSSSSSSNRKLDSNQVKSTVAFEDIKSQRDSDVTRRDSDVTKKGSDVTKIKRVSDVTKNNSKDHVESDDEEDNLNLFDEYDKYDKKKRKSAGKGDKNVKVSEAVKRSRIDKKEMKVIEIDDKDGTEEDEDEMEMIVKEKVKGEGGKEVTKQRTKEDVKESVKESVKEGMKEDEKQDVGSSDDDKKFLFNMSDDTDEQEEEDEEEDEEDNGDEEDDERGAGSQAFENYFSQRPSPHVRSRVSSRTDSGRNSKNEKSDSSFKNDVTISDDDDDDDDGRDPRGDALSSSRRLAMTASKDSDRKDGRNRSKDKNTGTSRVSNLLDLTGGGSDEQGEGSGSGSESDGLNCDDSLSYRNGSANRSSSSHVGSRVRANGDNSDRHSTDRGDNGYREKESRRENDRDRDRDRGNVNKRKRNSAINVDDIEDDSEEDEDDLFSSAMFRNKGSKDKGGRREESSSRAEPGPTHPNITPHFWSV